MMILRGLKDNQREKNRLRDLKKWGEQGRPEGHMPPKPRMVSKSFAAGFINHVGNGTDFEEKDRAAVQQLAQYLARKVIQIL